VAAFAVDTELQCDRLLDLIEYIEATERDRLKVLFDYRDHVGFRAIPAEIAMLPGVGLNCGTEDDPVWLRVDRLAKIAPPTPTDPEVEIWASYKDDVNSTPSLKSEVAISGLVELELLDPTDLGDRISLTDYARREIVELRFQEWIDGPWSGWVANEKPRRETIKLYNALYMLRQQLEGISEVPVELVCGMGFATLFRDGKRLRYPLLTMALELSLDDVRHCIEARPRVEADPSIEIDPLDRIDLHSLDQWRAATDMFLRGLDEESLSPFALETFEPALRQGAALLDADAVYVPDVDPSVATAIPSIETHLRISPAFAFFQRERRATQLMEDCHPLVDTRAGPLRRTASQGAYRFPMQQDC
jgi:hypothetical protein